MTREIKFEAWHELSKTMFVWEDISINGRNNCIIHITKGVFPTDGTENAVILRQSTGQFDKNGVEIFGGDILSLEGLRRIKSSQAGIVKNFKGCFVNFYGQDIVGRECYDYIHELFSNFQPEVIGNQWENKSIINDSIQQDLEDCCFEM